MNELSAQGQRDNNPGAAVSLSRKCYGILLSGRVADPERRLEYIPPIYQCNLALRET
jgi:hypothetical protein